jgi:hypothetical protein
VLRRIEEHRTGTSDHSARLWQILCLELWVRVVLEGSLDAGDGDPR